MVRSAASRLLTRLARSCPPTLPCLHQQTRSLYIHELQSQVLGGGGQYFLQGGLHIVKSDQVDIAGKVLGQILVTKKTGVKAKPVIKPQATSRVHIPLKEEVRQLEVGVVEVFCRLAEWDEQLIQNGAKLTENAAIQAENSVKLAEISARDAAFSAKYDELSVQFDEISVDLAEQSKKVSTWTACLDRMTPFYTTLFTQRALSQKHKKKMRS